MDAISATICNCDYFYFVSRFHSRAFSVVGNISLDKGAGEHQRHLMIFTGGPFWAEGLLLNIGRPRFTLPVQTKSTSSGLGRLGCNFRRQKQESTIFMFFSKTNKKCFGHFSLFTTFLFLLGVQTPTRHENDETRLQLLDYCISVLLAVSENTSACQS